jgi:hypothetical protein
MIKLRRWTTKMATRMTTLDGRLRQSLHVLATTQESEVVLLDLRSDQYFMLNDVGSRIWTLLAQGTTLATIIDTIRREYDVIAPAGGMSMERDVRELLSGFLAASLITVDASDRPTSGLELRLFESRDEPNACSPRRCASPTQAPSPLACAVILLAVRAGLKYGGLARTRRALRARIRQTSHVIHDSRLIDDCVRSVALAAAFFPGRALCLERSLTLWYVLGSRRIPVELCLGVQRFPFAAHAWVSYRGNPLNDVREHVEHFQPLVEQAS